MKAKELAELLMHNPDFEVQGMVYIGNATVDHPWPNWTTFTVDGIADIGYSEKIILLDCCER